MSAEFDGFEGKICTGRAAVDADGWIVESNIPEQCRECLDRAVEDKTALVVERNQYIDAIQHLGGLAVFNPIDADMWQSVTMRVPEEGWTREVEEASGFDDLKGQSYKNGTETVVKSLFFTCDN